MLTVNYMKITSFGGKTFSHKRQRSTVEMDGNGTFMGDKIDDVEIANHDEIETAN